VHGGRRALVVNEVACLRLTDRDQRIGGFGGSLISGAADDLEKK
jgi:hypothetical protein